MEPACRIVLQGLGPQADCLGRQAAAKEARGLLEAWFEREGQVAREDPDVDGVRSWSAAVLLAMVMWHPLPAGAQGTGPGRVRDDIDRTDRRIELAESLRPTSAPGAAADEINLAMRLQKRAHEAFRGRRYLIASRATLEARSHVDRAIALLQGLPDPDRIVVQLEQTAELVDRGRELLADCRERRSSALLKAAREMHDRAEIAAREGRFLAALQLTLSARERVQKAMRLCGVTEPIAATASRALERTDAVLAQATELARERAENESGSALLRAQSLQAEARSEFEVGRFERSIQLTQAARMIGHRILRRERQASSAGPRQPSSLPPR